MRGRVHAISTLKGLVADLRFNKKRPFPKKKNLFLHIDYIRTKNMEKQALNRIKVMLTEHMLTNKPT